MADNVKETEVVLCFWSKVAKAAFLGQFSDGWGEDGIEFSWPWREGIELNDATHLEVESFADPNGEGAPEEGYSEDRWYAPGFRD